MQCRLWQKKAKTTSDGFWVPVSQMALTSRKTVGRQKSIVLIDKQIVKNTMAAMVVDIIMINNCIVRMSLSIGKINQEFCTAAADNWSTEHHERHMLTKHKPCQPRIHATFRHRTIYYEQVQWACPIKFYRLKAHAFEKNDLLLQNCKKIWPNSKQWAIIIIIITTIYKAQ